MSEETPSTAGQARPLGHIANVPPTASTKPTAYTWASPLARELHALGLNRPPPALDAEMATIQQAAMANATASVREVFWQAVDAGEPPDIILARLKEAVGLGQPAGREDGAA